MSRYELAQAVAAGMENEVSIVEEENKKIPGSYAFR